MDRTCLIDLDFVNTVIKERPRDIHKGDCGRVLVIAGSKGMAGAAMLCARGALRSGAGLVRISAPEELYPILQVGVPEATCVSRDISKLDYMTADVIAIGPGLGDDKQNAEIIETVLKNYKKINNFLIFWLIILNKKLKIPSVSFIHIFFSLVVIFFFIIKMCKMPVRIGFHFVCIFLCIIKKCKCGKVGKIRVHSKCAVC